MRLLGIIAFVLSFATGAYAQTGWVLYAPEANTDVAPNSDGSAYMADLLRGYGDTFYSVGPEFSDDPAAIKAACVNRLKNAAQQAAYALQGFSYDMTLAVKGEFPPFKEVSCRIRATSDLKVVIETKEN